MWIGSDEKGLLDKILNKKIQKIIFCKRKNSYSSKAQLILFNVEKSYWKVSAHGQWQKTCLEINCQFKIRNTTDKGIQLAHAKIKGYELSELTQILYVKNPQTNYYGRYSIPPNTTTLGFLYLITSDITQVRRRKPHKVGVLFTDNEGRHYLLKIKLWALENCPNYK